MNRNALKIGGIVLAAAAIVALVFAGQSLMSNNAPKDTADPNQQSFGLNGTVTAVDESGMMIGPALEPQEQSFRGFNGTIVGNGINEAKDSLPGTGNQGFLAPHFARPSDPAQLLPEVEEVPGVYGPKDPPPGGEGGNSLYGLGLNTRSFANNSLNFLEGPLSLKATDTGLLFRQAPNPWEL